MDYTRRAGVARLEVIFGRVNDHPVDFAFPSEAMEDASRQGCEQLAVDPAKAAVRQNSDDITRARLVLDAVDDGLEIRHALAVASVAVDVGSQFLGVEAVVFRDFVKIGNRRDQREVGECESLGELVLENCATGGV
jgi:hypothetical protein